MLILKQFSRFVNGSVGPYLSIVKARSKLGMGPVSGTSYIGKKIADITYCGIIYFRGAKFRASQKKLSREQKFAEMAFSSFRMIKYARYISFRSYKFALVRQCKLRIN